MPSALGLWPNTRACGPRALGIHIRQIPRAHVTTITYVQKTTSHICIVCVCYTFTPQIKGSNCDTYVNDHLCGLPNIQTIPTEIHHQQQQNKPK